jgi:hypothetical protein
LELFYRGEYAFIVFLYNPVFVVVEPQAAPRSGERDPRSVNRRPRRFTVLPERRRGRRVYEKDTWEMLSTMPDPFDERPVFQPLEISTPTIFQPLELFYQRLNSPRASPYSPAFNEVGSLDLAKLFFH